MTVKDGVLVAPGNGPEPAPDRGRRHPAVAIPQQECFAAALQFARTEGIVPAPEPTHALAACIREAMACKETGEPKVILTALCGHGLLDLPAYESYLGGQMVDNDLSDEALAAALATVPVVPS